MSGTLVLIYPSCKVENLPWPDAKPPPFKMMSMFVKGPIQMIKVRWEGKVRNAYANEEGIIRGLPRNTIATKIYADYYRVPPTSVDIVGTIVVWVPDSKGVKK